MARTDTLPHFLTDVADAIRTKGGTSETIQASSFDTAISNLPSGADLSEYFTGELKYNYGQNAVMSMIKTIPNNTTVTGNDLRSAFNSCINLITIPNIDISNVTRLDGMCGGCKALVNFEIKSAPSCTGFQYMFSGCNALSDSSLDNILQMCASATNYTGTKTLAYLYITDRTVYPASRIQALPHYQDFINAGWTID